MSVLQRAARELQGDLPLLKRAGPGLAAISYDSRAALHDFAVRKKITFPLLSDHKSVVIQEYSVADRRYRKGAQLDVDSSGEVPVYGLADPSVFVLSPDGKVVWRFVSAHEELRLTAATILARSVGQFADQTRTPIDAGKLHLEATAGDTSATLGSRVTVGIELRIPPGWHVYAPEVGGDYRGIAWRMMRPSVRSWVTSRTRSRTGSSRPLRTESCRSTTGLSG